MFLVSRFELEDVDDFLFGGGDAEKACLPSKYFKLVSIDYTGDRAKPYPALSSKFQVNSSRGC